MRRGEGVGMFGGEFCVCLSWDDAVHFGTVGPLPLRQEGRNGGHQQWFSEVVPGPAASAPLGNFLRDAKCRAQPQI